MRPHPYRWIGTALALAGAVAAAEGQDLERAARAAAGPVRLAYAAAPNVCGAGDGILIREPDGSSMFVSGRMSVSDWHRWRDGDPSCETGDAVVRMRRAGSGWTDVRVTVGRDGVDASGGATGGASGGDRDADPAADLGFYTGQAAADFLLNAAGSAESRAGRRLILAAAIAGGAEIWPALLELARDRSLASRVRESAVHWLGRRAAREAVEALGGIVRDRTEEDRIREAAVFALSQLPEDEAIPILIDIARTNGDPRVVNRALFWLADFDDPRAVGVFEEILRGPGR